MIGFAALRAPTKALQIAAKPVRFSGIVDDLHQAGVTREGIKSEWKAKLWFVRYLPKQQALYIQVKPEDEKTFDRPAFAEWLKVKMQAVYQHLQTVAYIRKEKCCDGHCDGCLKRDGKDRKAWKA